MMKRKEPAGRNGGRCAEAGISACASYSNPILSWLTDPVNFTGDPLVLAAVYAANAASLVDDPDPEALEWAAHLLDLAVQALDRARDAALMSDVCQAAGDLDGAHRWGERVARHRAIARAALQGVDHD